ncbi:hypothetical protein FQR65_LT17021 [Abscondita terminalis]|nr:hypothetical protein FQR65_LT17021 [Abscondita terminalis]
MKTDFKKELLKAKQNKYAIPAFNFDNLEMLKGIVLAAEEEMHPVILMVTESAAKYMGFDYVYQIVMIDSSAKPFEINLKETKMVVEYAHQRGVYVESEIGHVGGKEDDRSSENKSYTDLNEAVVFNEKTGVDALAIAAGTAHGIFKNKPNIQFELINNIVSKIDTPIVLHGSSGVNLSDLQKAISLGITKINIGTDLKISNANAIKE